LAKDEIEYIRTPGADEDDYVFEQVENGKFVFFDKKAKHECSTPSSCSNYVPLEDCPWKLASQPEDYGDTEKLWLEISNFLVDHVFLPDERLYDVLTAWVLASWIPEKWDVIPYLLVKGPISSGKTRLLETLAAISYRGIFSANMTSAALFRVSELYRPTIFLDETEIYNKEEYSDVIHLLNAGYRRGQKAWRVEHDKNGDHVVKGYDVFGFKAFSGTEELANALQSRSIIIDMVKNVKPVSFSVNEKRAKNLRNKLLKYRFTILCTCDETLWKCDESDGSEGHYTPHIEEIAKLGDGRLLELFYCLLTVCNFGTENITNYAKDMYGIRQAEEQTTIQFQCLDALVKCKDAVEEGKVLQKVVTDKMNEGLDPNEKFKTRYVTKILSGLGFKKVHTRKGNAIFWNEKMLEYRIKQYRLEGYTPSVSSQSSQVHTVSSQSSVGEQFKFNFEDLKAVYWSNQLYDKHFCAICGYVKLTSWQAETFKGEKIWICDDCKETWEKQFRG
jgi:hypothetical protein